MLNGKAYASLNEHIDGILQKLPTMKEEYAEEIEATKQTGHTAVSDLRGSIIHSIIHDIRHESVMIFARNSDSRFPTDAEFQEMGKLVEMRIPEIRSVVNSLDWF